MAPGVFPLNKLRFSYLLMHYSYNWITEAVLWERRCSAPGVELISLASEAVILFDNHKRAAYDNSQRGWFLEPKTAEEHKKARAVFTHWILLDEWRKTNHMIHGSVGWKMRFCVPMSDVNSNSVAFLHHSAPSACLFFLQLLRKISFYWYTSLLICQSCQAETYKKKEKKLMCCLNMLL